MKTVFNLENKHERSHCISLKYAKLGDCISAVFLGLSLNIPLAIMLLRFTRNQ